MSFLENRLSEEQEKKDKGVMEMPNDGTSEVEKAVSRSRKTAKKEENFEEEEEEAERRTEGILKARMNEDESEEDDDGFDGMEEDADPYMTEEDEEFLEKLAEEMSEEQHLKSEKRNRRIRLGEEIALTVVCLYLIILIFGAFITEYHYGDEGTVEPVILSVSDIEEKNEFNSLASLYLQARSIYERVLVLDYRVAQNEEDLMNIAPEYEEELDNVSTLATSIEGADLLSKYNQISSMLLEWVQTHIAAYCQYMSAAITQNDSNAAEEAIAARSVVYSDFQLITENMISLGEDIKVYDLTDIKSWSPEGYVEEAVEGVE